MRNNFKIEIIKKNIPLLYLFIFICILYVFFNVLFAYVFQRLIDSVIEMSFIDFYRQVVNTFVTILFLCLTGYLKYKVYYLYLNKTLKHIKNDIFKSIFNKNFSNFEEKKEGNYINDLTININEIGNRFFDSLYYMISDIIMMLGSSIGIFLLNKEMAIMIVILSFLNIGIPILTRKSIGIRTNNYMNENSTHISYLKNILSGFTIIKIYDFKSHIIKKYSEVNNKLESDRYNLNSILCLSNTFINLFNYIAICIPWFVGAYFILNGYMTLGTVMGISQLNNNVSSPLNDFFSRLNTFYSGNKIMDQLSDYYDKNTNINKLNEGIESIHFKNVCVSKNNQTILDNITLEFNANHKYLIIGESGSGKSTILKLLMLKHFDYEGHININKFDFDDIDICNHIKLVMQDIFLFHDSLKNNICLYKEYNNQDILEVLDKVGLSYLEKRLDDDIYDNINNLSGGEKQRIAIARILLNPSEVIMFDEACSSLDSKLGFEIEKKILELNNSILIEVSHRIYPKLLPYYDEIIWMKKGKVYKKGNYNEMISNVEFNKFITI